MALTPSATFVDSSVDKRLMDLESRLSTVESTTTSLVMDQAELRQSVSEHEVWMQRLDAQIESARSAVDAIRAEVRSSTKERILITVLILIIIFILSIMT